MDSQGMLVYRYPWIHPTWEQRNWIKDYPEFKEALSGKEVSKTVFAPFEEKNRMVGFVPVTSIGWAASAGQTEDIAMEPIASQLFPQAAMLFLITLAAFGTSLLCSRFIVNSVKRLRNHAISLGNGETNEPMAATGPAEIKELGYSLDEMAEKLRSREADLREQRQWLQVTLSSIGDGVLTTDLEGRITFINPVAAALTGFTLEEAAGQPVQSIFKIIDEKTRAAADDVVARVLSEGKVVALANHTALITRDGSEIPIEDSAAPIKDSEGNISGVVLVFHDVTERRRAQDALRDSEERFRVMADSIPQLAWIAKADGYIYWYNQRWYDFTGTTPEQMEGWGWQSIHDPEALPGVLERWKQSLTTGKPFDMVFPLRGADGNFRQFLTRVEPVKDAHGNVIQWCGTNTDITERTRMELEKEITTELLHIINNSTGISDLVEAAATFFQKQSNCEAVGIRLKEGDDFPYFEARGFPEEFIRMENSLCTRDAGGNILRDRAGNPCIECMCGNVILERVDSSKPFFSPGGSFWANSTTRLLASTSDADRQTRTRNRCNGEGYESVALIPLYIGTERLGLIQLNDRRQNMFSPEIIALWERLAGYLSVAMSRSRTTKALSESEFHLARSQQLAHLGSWSWDILRNHLYWTDETYRLFGFQPGEVVPRHEDFLKLIHPDDRDLIEKAVQSALVHGGYDPEFRIIRKNGEERYVHSSGKTTFDENGNPVKMEGYVQDITEQKKAEARIKADLAALTQMHQLSGRLLEKEGLQPLLQEIMNAGVAIVEADMGTLQLFKDDCLRIVAAYGHRPAFLEFFEFAESRASVCGEATKRGERVVVPDVGTSSIFAGTPSLKVLREAGVRAVQSTPMMSRTGALIGILTTHWKVPYSPNKHDLWRIDLLARQAADLIEYSRAKEELRKSRDELDIRVQERTRALERSNEALREFASIASHDMREPLRKVMSFGNMLRRNYGSALEDAGNDYLNRMIGATERMQSLITSLLEYSRVTMDRDPFQEVDLYDLVHEILSDLEVRIVTTGGEVMVGALPVIKADPTQMRQLFQNLIANALKFYKQGEKPVVKVQSATVDGELQITVEDNGIGFEEQYYDKIFAAFQRLHGKSSQYEGTGMGLAICRKIVERHGGNITARSAPGKGATFIVQFPMDGARRS